jgi:TM2 domain-containing membrane protein YozV
VRNDTFFYFGAHIINIFFSMKKLLTLLVVALFFTIARANASTSEYTVDDTAVEAVFETGVQVSAVHLLQSLQSSGITSETTVQQDKSPIVAVVLATFLGGFGIHRVYLGGSPVLIPAYIFTCFGIFGIVPFVDWIVLLIGVANDDISRYVDNDKFFMWSGTGGGGGSR